MNHSSTGALNFNNLTPKQPMKKFLNLRIVVLLLACFIVNGCKKEDVSKRIAIDKKLEQNSTYQSIIKEVIPDVIKFS